jgi:hypothetical protein
LSQSSQFSYTKYDNFQFRSLFCHNFQSLAPLIALFSPPKKKTGHSN